MTLRPRRGLVGLALAVTLIGVGCGVDLDAEDLGAGTTDGPAGTEAGGSATTAPPTGDDALEQTLIDVGYSEAEAECGAAALREELTEEQIADLVEIEAIVDIPLAVRAAFTDALNECLDPTGGGDPDPDDPSDPEPEDPSDPDPDQPGPGMPDLPGDPGEGVTWFELVSALVRAGYAPVEARCVADDIFSSFDPETIDEIYASGGDSSELDPAVAEEVEQIFLDCT